MQAESTLNENLKQHCDPDKIFWVNYGPKIDNVLQLVEALENMDDYTFRYHVNEDHNKNDFADWIRTSLRKRELALRLEGVTDRKRYIKILKEELNI